MAFRTYPDTEQARLSEVIRAIASQHQTTSVYLWRMALELVNPKVVTEAPYCPPRALLDVYELLDVTTMP